MNAKLLFPLLAVATLAGGCQTIHVQDSQGNAIDGAAVWTVAEGGNTSPFKQSTMFGAATLSISIEPPGSREYLYVSKDGYLPNPYKKIRSADFNDTVTLRKEFSYPGGERYKGLANPPKGYPVGEQYQPKPKEEDKSGWNLDLDALWKKSEPKQPVRAEEK